MRFLAYFFLIFTICSYAQKRDFSVVGKISIYHFLELQRLDPDIQNPNQPGIIPGIFGKNNIDYSKTVKAFIIAKKKLAPRHNAISVFAIHNTPLAIKTLLARGAIPEVKLMQPELTISDPKNAFQIPSNFLIWRQTPYFFYRGHVIMGGTKEILSQLNLEKLILDKSAAPGQLLYMNVNIDKMRKIDRQRYDKLLQKAFPSKNKVEQKVFDFIKDIIQKTKSIKFSLKKQNRYIFKFTISPFISEKRYFSMPVVSNQNTAFLFSQYIPNFKSLPEWQKWVDLFIEKAPLVKNIDEKFLRDFLALYLDVRLISFSGSNIDAGMYFTWISNFTSEQKLHKALKMLLQRFPQHKIYSENGQKIYRFRFNNKNKSVFIDVTQQKNYLWIGLSLFPAKYLASLVKKAHIRKFTSPSIIKINIPKMLKMHRDNVFDIGDHWGGLLPSHLDVINESQGMFLCRAYTSNSELHMEMQFSGLKAMTHFQKVEKRLKRYYQPDYRLLLKNCKRVLKYHPDFIPMYIKRYQIHKQLKNYAWAIADLNKIISATADDKYYQERSLLHYASKKYDLALADQQQIWQQNSKQKVYALIRSYEITQKKGNKKEIAKLNKKIDEKLSSLEELTWPWPILAYYRGKIKSQELTKNKMHSAQINFSMAMQALFSKDYNKAHKYFNKAKKLSNDAWISFISAYEIKRAVFFRDELVRLHEIPLIVDDPKPEKRAKRAKPAPYPKLPAIHISSYDTQDPVKKGEKTILVVEVRNEGTAPVTNIQLDYDGSGQMIIDASVNRKSATVYGKSSVTFGVQGPLDSGEKLVFKIVIKVMTDTPFIHKAQLKYNGIPRAIVVEEPTTAFK